MKIKSTFTLLAISVIALLASCKKSDKKTDAPPPKKLKYLTQVIRLQGTATSFTNYTYDDKNRLSTIKTATSTVTYTYKGNSLFSEESVSSSLIETIEYGYNNDGILSSAHDVRYLNGNLSSDIVFNYLVVNGLITERHYQNIYVDKYSYDDKGNPIKYDSAVPGFSSTSTYDDKPSIYTNGFPKYTPSAYYSISPNNILTSSASVTYSYTYSYDTDGYPTSANVTSSSGAATKYTYVYTEM